MAKPTNAVLVEVFGRDLGPEVQSGQELWSITQQIIVPAGTDVEQLTANWSTGKFKDDPQAGWPVASSYVDISKIK